MRSALRPGDEVVAGVCAYRVDAVLGMGSNAIVYRVSYRDSLGAARHIALLKELFPAVEGVARVGAEIVVSDAALEAFDLHRQSFLRGNEAHLRQLRSQAGRVIGNLDSFEAHGTLYTLLEYQSSRTLEDALAEEQIASAERAARRLLSLLEALSPFHREGILHLDVSPDNLILMPVLRGYESDLEPMLLTDYNGVWDRTSPEPPVHLSKPGYSAPEARVGDADALCEATDLFSACAVFFRMLVGRQLTEAECCGQFLSGVCREVEKACDALPKTASFQAIQMIRKGLRPLPRQRYQSIEEMRDAVRELLDRIHMRGITHASLWEAARASLSNDALPERSVRMQIDEDGVRLPADENALLGAGGLLLLAGAGGMGKTTILRALHCKCVRTYSPGESACYYIPLFRYRGGANFLVNCLLERLRPADDSEDARAALFRFISVPLRDGVPRLLLLLDGLNEAGARREPLLREIRTLSMLPGVRIIASTRDETDRARLPEGIRMVRLLSPDDAEVDRYLSECGLLSVTPPPAREALRNPLLLSLYVQTWEAWRASGKSLMATDPDFTSADRLREHFLEGQLLRDEELHRESEADCLRARYAVEHVLPRLALAMGNRAALTREEARACLGRAMRDLRERDFARAFPAYTGKSRAMLEGIRTGDEWYDLMVREILVGRMTLLTLGTGGEISLFHESFQAGLAQEGRQLRIRRRTRGWRRAVVGIVCGLVLVGAGYLTQPFLPSALTRAEQSAVENLENAGYSSLLEVGQALESARGVRSALVAGGKARTAALLPLSGTSDAEIGVPWEKAALDQDAWQTVLDSPEDTSRLSLAALLVLSDAYADGHGAEYREERLSEYDEFCALQDTYLVLVYYAAYADTDQDALTLLYQGLSAQPELRDAFITTAKPAGDSTAVSAQRNAARKMLEESAFYNLAAREAADWPDAAAMAKELGARLAALQE